MKVSCACSARGGIALVALQGQGCTESGASCKSFDQAFRPLEGEFPWWVGLRCVCQVNTRRLVSRISACGSVVGRSSGRVALRAASQINTRRSGVRIGSLRAFESFGGRGPRRVVNRRNVSGGRLLHPHRGCPEARVPLGDLFDARRSRASRGRASATPTKDTRARRLTIHRSLVGARRPPNESKTRRLPIRNPRRRVLTWPAQRRPTSPPTAT